MNKYIIILLMSVISLTAWSQKIAVRGKVVDAITKEVLVGVNVKDLNSNKGTTTDIEGAFTLSSVDEGAILSFSFLGYEVIKTAAKKEMLIALKEDTTDLDMVVISASRTLEKRKDLPVAISSIPLQTIDEVNPTSVDQILNQTSGVNMVDLGNEQHMMAIRQPISTKSLFLYLEDGIPIRPTGVFNHNALLEMNVNASKNVEVIRGPYSALYGSEAIGGAINFITENPSDELTGKVGFSKSDIGYLKADAKISQTLGKTGVYVSGFYAAIVDGIRDYGDYDKTAITVKITHDFTDDLYLSNTFTYVDYYSETSGSMDDTKFENRDYSSYHTFTFRDDKALRFNSTLNKRWSDVSNTNLSFVYRNNSMGQNPSYRIADVDFDSHTSGELNDNSFQSFALYLQHNMKFDNSRTKLSFGGNIDFSPKSYYAKILDVYRDARGYYTSYTETGDYKSNYDVNILNTGLFVTGEIELFENFKLNAALRFDSYGYDFDNKLATATDYEAADTKETYTSFGPRVGLVYNFSEKIGMYTNYSVGYIPPSISELFREVDVPILDPTTFNNYEVGGWISALDNNLYFDYAFYYLQGKNEVVSVKTYTDGSYVYENKNVGETSHKGVEFGVRYKLLEQLNFHYSAAYSKHEYVDYVLRTIDGEVASDYDYSGNEMPLAPNYISNAGITYKPNYIKGLRIGLEWQHVGEYYTEDKNERTYEGYDVFHSRIGYDMKNLGFYLNIMNLTDELYSTRTTYAWGSTSYSPGNPLNFLFGVKYKF